MTPINVIAIDFREIKAVELRCKCGAVMSLPLPKTTLSEHVSCVGCNSTLWVAQAEGSPHAKVQALLRAIGAWQQVEAAPFTLGFSLETFDRASGGKD